MRSRAIHAFAIESLETRLLLSAAAPAVDLPADSSGASAIHETATVALAGAQPSDVAEGSISDPTSDLFEGVAMEPLERDFSLSSLSVSAQGGGTWTGDIANGTVWGSGMVQRITGNIRVPAGSTLTIQPGAIVKFNAGTQLKVEGTLNAVGTEASPIHFTSVRDDSVGGDTNGDATATQAAAGDWDRIWTNGIGAKTILDYCRIQFAGKSGSQPDSAASISSGELIVTNSLIQRSLGEGLWVAAGKATLNENTIDTVDRFGIRVDTNEAVSITNNDINGARAGPISIKAGTPQVLTGNTSSNSGLTNFVRMLGGTIADARTWGAGLNFYVPEDITIGATGSLTLAPGLIVKLNASRFQVEGTMTGIGTSQLPIFFTSFKDDSIGGDTNGDGAATTAAAGDWNRIWVANQVGAKATFENARFAFGGKSGSAPDGIVTISKGELIVRNSTVERSFGEGVWIAGGKATIENNRISQTANFGVRVDTNELVTITNNTIQGAKAGPITIRAGTPQTLTGNTSSESGLANSIRMLGGTIADVRTWEPGLNYVVPEDITIASTGSLTISPGLILKMTNSRFEIAGVMTAIGTEQSPIWFTSLKDDSVGGDANGDSAATIPVAGDWNRVWVNGTSGKGTFDNVHFSYGGKSGSAPDGLVTISRGELIVRNSFVEHSFGEGVWLAGGKATIENNTISDTTNFGVRIETNDPVSLTGNRISSAKAGPLRFRPESPLTATGNSSTGSGRANAALVSSGSINGLRVWNDGIMSYVVEGLDIGSAGILELGAGRVLKMSTGARITVLGTLTAQGTEAAPVIFTSIRDDANGNDTNGDAGVTLPAPGDWDRIWVNDNAAKVTLDFTRLLYGGKIGGSQQLDSSISISRGLLNLSNSLVQFGAADGIWIAGGNATVTGTTIRDVKEYGFRVDERSIHQVLTNNLIERAGDGAIFQDSASDLDLTGTTWTASGRANAVVVGGGSVTTTRRWMGDTTYWLTDNLAVSGNLTVGAGAILKLPLRKGIQVDGTMILGEPSVNQGTQPNPVIITSARDDVGGDTNLDGSTTVPAAGDFFSLWHRSGNVTLQNVEIRFAGVEPISNNFAPTPAILSDGGTLRLDHVLVRDVFDVGLRARARANVIATNLEIENTGAAGISVQSGSLQIDRLNLNGIGGSAMTVTPGSLWTLQNVELGTAKFPGMEVIGDGTVSGPWTLGQFGTVIFTGQDSLTIDPTRGSLEILPGTILKMPPNFHIEANGPFRAVGSAIHPIVFTSIRDDTMGGDTNRDGVATLPAPGDWGYIALRNSNSQIENVRVNFGGKSNVGVNAAVLMNGGLTLKNTIIDHSSQDGLVITGPGLAVVNNLVVSNFAGSGVVRNSGTNAGLDLFGATIVGGKDGVYLANQSATITNSIISGASEAGIYVTGANAVVNSNYNLLFNPNSVRGNSFNSQSATWKPAGGMGIVTDDPKFFDPSAGVFELGDGSPAIDAGLVSDAHALGDLLDRARRNDTAVVNRGSGVVPFADIGAFERTLPAPNVDLIADDIRADWIVAPDALPNGFGGVPSQVKFTFSMTNSSDVPIVVNPLTNQFFIQPTSLGETPRDFPVILLGERLYNLNLAGGASATFTETFVIPTLFSGPYTAGITLDATNAFPESGAGELNNTTEAVAPLLFVNPVFTPGVPIKAPIDLNGVIFDLPESGNLIKLGSLSILSPVNAKAYLFNEDADFSLPPDWKLPPPLVLLPAGTPVDVQQVFQPNSFLFLLPDTLAPQGAEFTASFFTIDAGRIERVFPSTLGNSGLGTLRFFGGPFPDDASIGLAGPNNMTVLSQDIQYTEEGVELIGQFNLNGVAAGEYVPFVQMNGTRLTTAPIEIVNGGADPLRVTLTGPDVLRAGVPMPFQLQWFNPGFVDSTTNLIQIPMPSGAHITFDPDDRERVTDLTLFGVSGHSTNFLSLPAQSGGHMDFYLTLDPGQPLVPLTVTAAPIDSPSFQVPADWGSFLDSIKQPTAGARWDQMKQNFLQDLPLQFDQSFKELLEDARSFDPSIPEGSSEISPDRIDDLVGQGESQISNLVGDKIAKNYPTPSNPAAGDGIHQDYVIIIAIEDYSSSFAGLKDVEISGTGLKVPLPVFNANLPGTQGDADLWVDYFRNDLNIPSDQITVLRDRIGTSDDNMTFDKMRKAWQDTVAKVDADDKIKFIYSGHGSANGGSMVMNTPYNAAQDQYVTADKLKELFAGAPSELFMVFDSCHSQTMGLGLQGISRLRWNAAVSSDETAPDSGTYSENFIDALRDQSNDLNSDKKVFISEATIGAKQTFSNAKQHPQSGGDPKVDQELHDDIGNATRQPTLGQRIGNALRNVAAAVTKTLTNVFAHDPNEKTGPVGFGPDHYLAGEEMFFSIYFENDAQRANAAAQVVTVTDRLSPNLDWSTLAFGLVQVGQTTLTLAGTGTNAHGEVYLVSQDVVLSVDATLNGTTGELKWVFRTLDPATRLATKDPLAGFLPPNVTKPEGEGHVNFTVRPKAGLAHGTEIRNSASIVFDANEAILTNELSYRIDAKAPVFQEIRINGGAAQRDHLSSIDIVFTEDTTITASLDAFRLLKRSDGSVVSLTGARVSVDPSTKTLTLDVQDLSVAPGNYSFTLIGSGVKDEAGLQVAGDHGAEFFIQPGSAAGNRQVNDLDLYRVWQNLLKPVAQRDVSHDLNRDGQVTAEDLNVVRANYLKTLPAPSPTLQWIGNAPASSEDRFALGSPFQAMEIGLGTDEDPIISSFRVSSSDNNGAVTLIPLDAATKDSGA